MKFVCTVLVIWASLGEIQATSWDLNFNFSNYQTRARLLVTNCNNIRGLINLVLGAVLRDNSIVEPVVGNNVALPHVFCVSDDTMFNAINLTIYAADGFTSKIVDNRPNRQTEGRQLLEMRVYGRSQPVLRASEDTNYIYAWWFYLKPSFSVTNSFTHIFRLRAVGQDVDQNDLVTFTLTRRDGLHLRVRDDTSKTITYQTMLDLASATGTWIQAFVKVQFKRETNSPSDSDVGSAQIILKDINGRVLYPPREDTGLFINNMYPIGTSYVVPRWGIYRQSDSEINFNPSDWQLFQNINIWKKD